MYIKNSVIFLILPLIVTVFLVTGGCEKEKRGLPRDGDGNEYDTVVIGTQVWLKENLKTTRFNNGVPILNLTDNDQWASTTRTAYCWYNNNPVYKDNYGALYKWYAARGNICPVGWHVPTKEDWETLINYLGGESVAGGKLKDTKFWASPNYGATNESGFSARPAGGSWGTNEDVGGRIGVEGKWWSSSPWSQEKSAWHIIIYNRYSSAEVKTWMKSAGFSVRCIKNN